MSDLDYSTVVAEIVAAYDAGADWPGGPLCKVDLSEAERVYAYRYARDFYGENACPTGPDGAYYGALVFHREESAGTKYMGVVVLWEAFREIGAVMLRGAHNDARDGMDALGDAPPWVTP